MMKRLRATMRGLRDDERGAAMVEFAIIAPLLFLLVFGIVDAGRAYFLVNNLTNAAREGARLGAVLPMTGSTDAIKQRVYDLIDDSGKDLDQIEVLYNGVAPNRTVRVRINDFPFDPVTFLFMGTKALDAQAEFRHETQT